MCVIWCKAKYGVKWHALANLPLKHLEKTNVSVQNSTGCSTISSLMPLCLCSSKNFIWSLKTTSVSSVIQSWVVSQRVFMNLERLNISLLFCSHCYTLQTEFLCTWAVCWHGTELKPDEKQQHGWCSVISLPCCHYWSTATGRADLFLLSTLSPAPHVNATLCNIVLPFWIPSQ